MSLVSGKGSRALVTGATGFVGTQLCPTLAQHGWHVVCASRSPWKGARTEGLQGVVLPLSSQDVLWQNALHSVRCVVHLAAHVHQMHDDPRAANVYREVNVAGSQFVAEQAARAGVRRFVYLSSIKVNGEGGGPAPYRAEDAPNPLDDYGRSKWRSRDRPSRSMRSFRDGTGNHPPTLGLRPRSACELQAIVAFGSHGIAVASGLDRQPAQPRQRMESRGFHRDLHDPSTGSGEHLPDFGWRGSVDAAAFAQAGALDAPSVTPVPLSAAGIKSHCPMGPFGPGDETTLRVVAGRLHTGS